MFNFKKQYAVLLNTVDNVKDGVYNGINDLGEGRSIILHQSSQVSYYGKALSRGVGDRLYPSM